MCSTVVFRYGVQQTKILQLMHIGVYVLCWHMLFYLLSSLFSRRVPPTQAERREDNKKPKIIKLHRPGIMYHRIIAINSVSHFTNGHCLKIILRNHLWIYWTKRQARFFANIFKRKSLHDGEIFLFVSVGPKPELFRFWHWMFLQIS